MPIGQSHTEELRTPRRPHCSVRLAGVVGLFALGTLLGGGAVAAPVSGSHSLGSPLAAVLRADLDPGAEEVMGRPDAPAAPRPGEAEDKGPTGDPAPANPDQPAPSPAPGVPAPQAPTTGPAPQAPSSATAAPATPSTASTSGSTGGRRVSVSPGRDSVEAPTGSGAGQHNGPADMRQPVPQRADRGADDPARSPGSEPSGASSSPGATQDAASTDGPPSSAPVPPVSSADQLTKDNAGSVSGGRQGDEVILYLPSTAVQPKEWVSVFTYPEAKDSGWLEVSGERSVVISISGMEAGSYKLAVANSSGKLLGWAQLEISEANQADDGSSFVSVAGAVDSDNGMRGGDWLLLCAVGVLVAGAGGFVFLTRPRMVGGL